jgi:hypothetical protein
MHIALADDNSMRQCCSTDSRNCRSAVANAGCNPSCYSKPHIQRDSHTVTDADAQCYPGSVVTNAGCTNHRRDQEADCYGDTNAHISTNADTQCHTVATITNVYKNHVSHSSCAKPHAEPRQRE